ncbi:MAG: outer membrane beta-barrel protein [Ignavibacteriales bacterium]|nr:outer membrane beta-barrel protein [Ignavibacteriales bacterium]MCB9259667.1 outer membrane beta-barrel protein [Ignavibacteriales bacterium]
MNKYFTYIFLFLFISANLFAQYNGSDFSVSTNFSFNTNAKIFLSPDAESIFDQNNYFEIEDILSYSAEFRYRLNDALIFGLSLEYMQGSDKGRNLPSKQFIVKDGYELYPVELSAYYFLPFSTEDFKFYMGGGFGIYSGKRTREFGNIKFDDVDSEIGYGIQVSVGMDYMIFNQLSVRGELRFRDPDFKITNKYNSDRVTYEGNNYSVTQENITSKLNVDGITFRIGTVFHFSINQ